ncbi:MAG: molybdopterin dinucleotide binding domain-containing protein [Spirochaetaceae bacterium]
MERLRKLYPQECYVEIHPDDAALLGIGDAQKVKISSRRGESVMNAKIDKGVRASQPFIPTHYPETNWLTFPAFDLYSFEPTHSVRSYSASKAPKVVIVSVRRSC